MFLCLYECFSTAVFVISFGFVVAGITQYSFTLIHQMERFPDPLDLFHMSFWEKARRKRFERGGPFKNLWKIHLVQIKQIFFTDRVLVDNNT